jgi:hypothetical protein
VVAVPNHPRGSAGAVEVFKFLTLFKGIHASPEPVVRIGKQLTLGDQPVKGLFHQLFSLFDVAEDLAPE